MAKDTALNNPQMRKAYLAALGIGAGGILLGGGARAYTALRDQSPAFGDINHNLRLLAAEDPYLADAGGTVVLPKKKDKKDKAEREVLELDNAFDSNKVASQLSDAIKSTFNFTGDFLTGRANDARDLSKPVSVLGRGSVSPSADGSEKAVDIPMTYALGFPALLAGAGIGHTLVDAKIKRVADDKVKAERDKAKREFEAALMYEQDAAAKSRRKSASEESDLVNAVDEFYSACARYSHYEKQAANPPAQKGKSPAEDWSMAKILMALVLAGSTTAAWGMMRNSYGNTRKAIEQEEKEKLLGLKTDYSGVYKDLTSKHLNDQDMTVRTRRAPKINEQLIRFKDEPEEEVEPIKPMPTINDVTF
jgi:hypothetical protein